MGFILVGKVFRKGFRILGLDERKGRRVVEQDFHGNFQVNVTWFFAFLNCAYSGKISSLCSRYRTKLSLTIKTDDFTSRRRDVDLHGRLRGRKG